MFSLLFDDIQILSFLRDQQVHIINKLYIFKWSSLKYECLVENATSMRSQSVRNKRPVACEAPLLHKNHFLEGQQQCSRALQSKFHSSINIYNRQNNETAGFSVLCSKLSRRTERQLRFNIRDN